jgi:hypothetical protein
MKSCCKIKLPVSVKIMGDAIPFIDYLIEYNLSFELYSALSLANFKPIKSLIVRFLFTPLKNKTT